VGARLGIWLAQRARQEWNRQGCFLEKGNIDITYTKRKDACRVWQEQSSIFAAF
jgi:hypothetical protein